MLDGELAWRQHDGGHTDTPNIPHFVKWMEKLWAEKEGKAVDPVTPGNAAAEKKSARVEHKAIERRDPNSRAAHEQLLAKAKQGQIDVYFQGDSITRRWGALDYPKLLENFTQNFHGWNAGNFAWGGDNTHNILWRLQNGELDGVSPKVVVLQAGTNNLPWRGAANESHVEDVVDGIEAIIAKFQDRTPDATIVLTAVFPRTQNLALALTISKINGRLQELAIGERIRFLNINDKLADSTGKLLPGVSSDGLHLEEKGYQIWADSLKPILTEILGPAANEDHAPPATGDPSAAARSATPAPRQRRRQIKWVNPDIPQTPGLSHRVISSDALGHDVGYVVWTPPEFDDSGSTRYPVIYFLHGAGGSEKSDSAGFSSRVSKAIRAGKFPPTICVFPNGGLSGYRGKVESMIVKELIPLIDKSYPTKSQAAGRAVCGFSMGGAGSVHLSIRHPELFCAAGSWGGALSFRGRGDESPLLQTVKEHVDKLKENRFALLTVNGDDDRPNAFMPLEHLLTSLEISHRLVVLEDTNHNLGKYYERAGDTMLKFLAEQLNRHSDPALR